MNKKRVIVIISSITIVAILVVLIIRTKHIYPSVIDSSYKSAPNVNFSAALQVSENSKQLVCTIENKNEHEITYEEKYYLEIEKDGKWYEIIDRRGKRADEGAWTTKLYVVEAKGRKEFSISLDSFRELSDGKYRIVKYMNLSENDKDSEYIVIAPFQVKDN